MTRRWVRAMFATMLVAATTVSIGGTATAAPPYPAPVMRGYVPLGANATRQTLANASASAGTILDFTVGITNAGAGAVMYYDHWEDGYESDLTDPQQSSTQVWGDGDTGNGNAATACGIACAGDALPAGAVFVLRNNVPTPRDTTILWDGRDRVSSTRGFTITAGGFTTSLGSLLSASASAYDTSKWGDDYWIPIGQNMVPPSGTSHAFSTTNIQVMADQPGTVVDVDRTGDGITDVSQTIGAGEIMFVSGGVNRGARVRSSKPVQVHVGAGDTSASYEMRWFTLFPTALLTSDYLNPVGSSVDNQRTITYLFNPGATPITVTPTCTGCTGSIPVAAKGGASYASPLGQAVRFQSGGGEPFVAVGAVGSESGAAPGSGSDASSSYDWGFGLVPTKLLTTKAVLGWAPGNSANPPNVPGNRDDDPVWITAMAATTIYIDYDGNPATGSLGPQCDGKYDEARSVAALASTRIFDNSDGDMTGASIYTCDGTKIAGAWGQDPQNAPAGAPGFDAGYALIPSTAMLVDKTGGAAHDANGDGRIGPGDTIAYEISIADAGAVSFTDIRAVDPLPAGTTYVPGSTTYDDGSGGGPVVFPDDTVPPAATAYPFDELGAAVPTIDPGTTIVLGYQVRIDDPFPPGTTITNSVSIGADQTDGGDTVVTELVAADLSLDKSLVTTPDHLGEHAVFRLTVANAGTDDATGVEVTDLLPAGLTFVEATPSQGAYDAGTGVWTVGTVANGATATLDLEVVVGALSVTNFAEVSASEAADPDSSPASGPTGQDDEDEVTITVSESADLSLTKTLASGPDASGHTTFTLTVANAGPSTATGVQVTDHPPASASFVSASAETSAAADGTFDGGTGVWTVPDLGPGMQARMHVVYHTPVAPDTNYAQVSAADLHDPDSQPDTTPLGPGNPPDEDDEAAAGVPAVADLSVGKVVKDTPSFVGDLATFSITVTNDGPTDTTDVMVTDVLPTGLDYVSSDPSTGTFDPLTGVWNVGALTPAATETLEVVARVRIPGTITNVAELTSSSAADPDSTPGNTDPGEDDQAEAAVTTVGGALGDLVWYDVDRDGVPDPGEPGLAGAAVEVRWAGPNDTFFDGDDVAVLAVTGADGTWSVTGLPHGQYRVTVDQMTLPHGIRNAVSDRDGSASPDTTDLTLAGGQALHDVDFAYVGSGAVGDTVFLDTDGDHAPGADEGIADARVELRWAGPNEVFGDGDDVVVSTVTDADGHYELVDLPAGAFRVEVDASSLPAGTRNVVDPDGGDDGTAELTLARGGVRDDVDFGYTVPFDLALDKSADGPAVVGADVTWRLTVTNQGMTDSPADLTITDPLPEGLTFRSASGDGWSCTAEGSEVTCTGGGPLAAGATSELLLVTRVDAPAGTTITNHAAVEAGEDELILANNDSGADVLVQAADGGPQQPATPQAGAAPAATPAASTGAGGPIAYTGATPSGWLRAGILLLVLGSLLVAFTRAGRFRGWRLR